MRLADHAVHSGMTSYSQVDQENSHHGKFMDPAILFSAIGKVSADLHHHKSSGKQKRYKLCARSTDGTSTRLTGRKHRETTKDRKRQLQSTRKGAARRVPHLSNDERTKTDLLLVCQVSVGDEFDGNVVHF